MFVLNFDLDAVGEEVRRRPAFKDDWPLSNNANLFRSFDRLHEVLMGQEVPPQLPWWYDWAPTADRSARLAVLTGHLAAASPEERFEVLRREMRKTLRSLRRRLDWAKETKWATVSQAVVVPLDMLDSSWLYLEETLGPEQTSSLIQVKRHLERCCSECHRLHTPEKALGHPFEEVALEEELKGLEASLHEALDSLQAPV